MLAQVVLAMGDTVSMGIEQSRSLQGQCLRFKPQQMALQQVLPTHGLSSSTKPQVGSMSWSHLVVGELRMGIVAFMSLPSILFSVAQALRCVATSKASSPKRAQTLLLHAAWALELNAVHLLPAALKQVPGRPSVPKLPYYP